MSTWSFVADQGQPGCRSAQFVEPGINSNMGDIELVPQPVRFSGVDPIPTMAHRLGEHTELVLREKLKLDEDKKSKRCMHTNRLRR